MKHPIQLSHRITRSLRMTSGPEREKPRSEPSEAAISSHVQVMTMCLIEAWRHILTGC